MSESVRILALVLVADALGVAVWFGVMAVLFLLAPVLDAALWMALWPTALNQGWIVGAVVAVVVPWFWIRRSPERWSRNVMRLAPFVGVSSVCGAFVCVRLLGVMFRLAYGGVVVEELGQPGMLARLIGFASLGLVSALVGGL